MAPRARAAVTAIFFLNGVVFSSWYARLPAIQDDLGLSSTEIGIALLGAPAGLLVAQPVVGALVARRGSRWVLAAAPVLFAPAVLPALAVDLPTLLLAVTVVGAANGVIDIAMNAQGVAVERALGRRIFNSLHAAFSFGALGGASAAAVAAALEISPLPQLAVMALLGSLGAAAAARRLLPDRGDPEARLFARPTWRLAALGTIAFCVLLAEGAVFDWSGIYLTGDAGATAGVAPLGLAAFSLTMGIGRLVADRLATLVGPVALGGGGAALAAGGLGLALGLAEPAAAIIGFAAMGAGLSAVFPLTLLAAGLRADGAASLAAVSTVGYTGFLLGPPLIGLLSGPLGLRGALVPVCLLCLLAAILCGRLATPTGMNPRSPRR